MYIMLTGLFPFARASDEDSSNVVRMHILSSVSSDSLLGKTFVHNFPKHMSPYARHGVKHTAAGPQGTLPVLLRLPHVLLQRQVPRIN